VGARVTSDALVNRVRSICAGTTFNLRESQSTEDFSFQPSGAHDGVFRVQLRGGSVRSGLNYSEERTDLIDVMVTQAINANYHTATDTARKLANSLTVAIIRDGHETSGDYSVPDQGRAMGIEGREGDAMLTLRLTLPANYETTV
jgi:hypothetical protein